MSVVLLFVWPVIFGALVALGKGIAGMDGIGAGIYAFLNRLLIPTGLHHALNNVFWFDTIGLGDLSHFWAGETSADVGWSLGMYMSGFFPCMMFGILGAALAMIKTAKNTAMKRPLERHAAQHLKKREFPWKKPLQISIDRRILCACTAMIWQRRLPVWPERLSGI